MHKQKIVSPKVKTAKKVTADQVQANLNTYTTTFENDYKQLSDLYSSLFNTVSNNPAPSEVTKGATQPPPTTTNTQQTANSKSSMTLLIVGLLAVFLLMFGATRN